MNWFRRKLWDLKNLPYQHDIHAEHNIRLLRESELFDPDYYLERYPDVADSDLTPEKHYYFYGWREGRDPSAHFDNDYYLRENHIRQNPLVHYLTGGKNDPAIKVATDLDSASNLLQKYFQVCAPLCTMPVADRPPCLNVYFTGFDKSCFFGGKATALVLAVQYANACGCALRIIAQQPEAEIFGEFLELFSLDRPADVSFYATRSGERLEVGERDDFLCTMWENADSALHTPDVTGRIFYIMQEVETFFYDHGDRHLRCYQTLSDPRLIPVVNSQLLFDYLAANGYDNVRERGICFEPVFSSELLKPGADSFAEKERYTLLYYARPGHQRNIFYFGLQCLNEAFVSGRLDPKKWTVYTVGDTSVSTFVFDVPVPVKRLGVMSWKEYCEMLSTVDLCYSMIYTPHPSYPPLDAVTAGAVSVTNRFANKQDFSRYSDNIVSAPLQEAAMLDALEVGGRLAMDAPTRERNYRNSHTAGDWKTTFEPVVERMRNS